MNLYHKNNRKKINMLSMLESELSGGILIFFICQIYEMQLISTVVTVAVALIFVPLIRSVHLSQKEYRKQFEDINIYMEQILYSFRKEQRIAAALEDVEYLFSEGKLKDCIRRANEKIKVDAISTDISGDALRCIEDTYKCQRLVAEHRFMQKVERLGGDYSDSIELLLMERSMWQKRIGKLQQERDRIQRNVKISVVLTLALCYMSMTVLPGKIDIMHYNITSVSSMLLIISCMFVVYISDSHFNINWLEFKRNKNEKKLAQQYERFINYDEKNELLRSVLYSIFPALMCIISIYRDHKTSILVFAIITFVMLQQHKIGHQLNMRLVTKEVQIAFPQWLMEMALLLQGNNVQVSIIKSIEGAPQILQPALRNLVSELAKAPESERPYLEFLSEIQVFEIHSAMRMLYSVATGRGGDFSEQIREIIRRNNVLLDLAEDLENEDRVAGESMYMLMPMMFGSMKIVVDMAVFMIGFITGVL